VKGPSSELLPRRFEKLASDFSIRAPLATKSLCRLSCPQYRSLTRVFRGGLLRRILSSLIFLFRTLCVKKLLLSLNSQQNPRRFLFDSGIPPPHYGLNGVPPSPSLCAWQIFWLFTPDTATFLFLFPLAFQQSANPFTFAISRNMPPSMFFRSFGAREYFCSCCLSGVAGTLSRLKPGYCTLDLPQTAPIKSLRPFL